MSCAVQETRAVGFKILSKLKKKKGTSTFRYVDGDGDKTALVEGYIVSDHASQAVDDS
jgi:hypothetical protein